MRHLGRFVSELLLLFLAALEIHAENPSLPLVMANNNRTPAGQLKHGVLKLELEKSESLEMPTPSGRKGGLPRVRVRSSEFRKERRSVSQFTTHSPWLSRSTGC